MITLHLVLFLAILIPMIILFLTFTLSTNTTRQWKDRELASPFECGFSPVSQARMPFSLRFFLLAVLFIIFDVEIIILMPMPLILDHLPMINTMSSFATFLLIVTAGLVHEWKEGSLEWMK